jgi:hypothetical protein
MSANLTPFNSDGGFNTAGNITSGNITTSGIANVNSMNISQSIRWDYSNSQIYEDGGLVINGPGGLFATGNIAAQFEFNDGAGNSSGIYSDANSSILYGNTYTIVRSNNAGGGGYRDWTFGVDGNLTIPGNINFTNDAAIQTNSVTGVTIYGNSIDQSTALTLNNSGDAALWANANVTINSDSQGSNPQWVFDNTGNLTLPRGGKLLVSGGIVGGGASPAPSLSGFSSLTAYGNITGGNILTGGYLSVAGDISAVGNVTGGNIVTSGSGGDITLTGGNITGAGNISATGNITAANFIGNIFSLAQTILPTIQSIVISNTSSEYETSGGSGYANVLVANVAPVIEYGVIVTAGSTVDKYVIGNLANIPGTEKITISTGTSDQPFTVYAYVTTNAGTYYSGPEVGFSGQCLLKGTMISLANGTYKPIEDIDNDDLLLTWDFDLGQYAQARPLWIKRGESGTRYNKLTFSDGTTLRTFDQHRIFNKQAGAFTYPMSDDTPIGTVTVNEHGQEITLVKREIVWDTIEHYNIITDHHINLFADSILTSCRFNNIYPITDMKFVKDTILNRNLSEFAEIEGRFVSGLRLQEQSFELAMIKGYVNRLLATEAMELIGV